ncbi:MAG: hypothetical protein Q8Q07_02960 [Dehalococcoidales bacterium]|nr:hypothetical protein [Dehalococcoidales bacterium]
MKKLVCDRCGKELIDKDDLGTALEGKGAWAAAARARGQQPRGILPCEHYVRCGGEMTFIKEYKVLWWHLRFTQPPNSKSD